MGEDICLFLAHWHFLLLRTSNCRKPRKLNFLWKLNNFQMNSSGTIYLVNSESWNQWLSLPKCKLLFSIFFPTVSISNQSGKVWYFYFAYCIAVMASSQDAFGVVCSCDTLCEMVPFVQFKKGEQKPWRSVTYSKVAGWMKPATLPKLTLLQGYFFTFFKLYKWYQIAQSIKVTLSCVVDIEGRNVWILTVSFLASI